MNEFTCADCAVKACRSHEPEKMPKTCPSKTLDRETSLSFYSEEEFKMAHEAALTESDGYCRHTRLEETMAFAYRMGYKKLGIGFCNGLKKEAEVVAKIFRENGFEVTAIVCKCGSILKEAIDIKDSEQVRPGQAEPMCNPAAQAEYLNAEGTDFNVLLGLCVGHDSLFIKHSKAPVTVLVSKDRALAHNPIGAIYQSDAYLSRVHTFIKDNFGEKN